MSGCLWPSEQWDGVAGLGNPCLPSVPCALAACLLLPTAYLPDVLAACMPLLVSLPPPQRGPTPPSNQHHQHHHSYPAAGYGGSRAEGGPSQRGSLHIMQVPAGMLPYVQGAGGGKGEGEGPGGRPVAAVPLSALMSMAQQQQQPARHVLSYDDL